MVWVAAQTRRHVDLGDTREAIEQGQRECICWIKQVHSWSTGRIWQRQATVRFPLLLARCKETTVSGVWLHETRGIVEYGCGSLHLLSQVTQSNLRIDI